MILLVKELCYEKIFKALLVIVSLFLSIIFASNVSADTHFEEISLNERVIVQKYIQRSDYGFLILNIDEVIISGISNELLYKISPNISEMNTIILEGRGYIGSDNVLRYRNQGVSFRSAGSTRVETYWWGETRVYISANDVKKSLPGLKQGGVRCRRYCHGLLFQVI
ncbi:hypothetical protein ABID29_001321 [Streptococcus rupicaprae]|uniref:Uncharacterized protein n=1 Tax=Streptococcus rupicaprae TaxID=759619 RepID=A0ABV2FI33_9STRE